MSRIWIYLILSSTVSVAQRAVTISGFVRTSGHGEAVPDANVIADSSYFGTTSNAYGFYSLNVPAGSQTQLRVSHVGYRPTILQVTVLNDTVIHVFLEAAGISLDEITVEARRDLPSLADVHIGANVLRQTPVILGEKDILKTIQLLPGVLRGVEGSTSFFVRGATADQNLITWDEATVYNANHLFGFVSIFNTDAVSDVRFYKGSFPARYGGRVSSVTDIRSKDGSKERLGGQAGIGLLSSKFLLEGPLNKAKSSTFVVSGRRTFIDLLVAPFLADNNRTGYRFFDLNGKLTIPLDASDKLLFSLYQGGDKLFTVQKVDRDDYSIDSRVNLGWTNGTATLRWNHNFSSRIFSNTSLIYSRYKFSLDDTYRRVGRNPGYRYSVYTSQVTDLSIKKDVDLYASQRSHVTAGVAFALRDFMPRRFVSREDVHEQGNHQRFRTHEFSAYLHNELQLTASITSNVGLRATSFRSSGKTFYGYEPRLHLYARASDGLRFNAGYTRAYQFMHLLSNTGVGLPTDLWVPATRLAPPQDGHQLSAGVTKALGKFLLSAESYRRWMNNILTYKPTAEFLDPDELSKEIVWEENVTGGKGESYGTEVLLKKEDGLISGWVAYTLSWAVHQFDDINNGQRFFPRHDSRHNATIFVSYKPSQKVIVSVAWYYATGQAYTVPQGYYYGNIATGASTRTAFTAANRIVHSLITEEIVVMPYSGSKNSFRAESYHRLDISVQFHRKKAKFERYWEFGLFNAYNRKNPYYYYLSTTNDFVNKGQRIDLEKRSLFPVLPSISYNIKF